MLFPNQLQKWRERKAAEKSVTKQNQLENLIKIAGIIIGILGFVITYSTYKDTEKWKKAEFAVPQIKVFQKDTAVQLVTQILDWDKRTLPLFKGGGNFYVSETRVESALMVDSMKSDFDTVETRIRDVFDEYFEELGRLDRYYKEGVMDTTMLRPVLSYQLALVADIHHKRKSDDLSALQKRLWEYIDYYKFADVQDLFKTFGYNINPKNYPPLKIPDNE